jgi:hypothetical protein
VVEQQIPAREQRIHDLEQGIMTRTNVPSATTVAADGTALPDSDRDVDGTGDA